MEQDWSVEGPASSSALVREASDAQTAPERLIELSAMPEIRPLVAANAATPAEHLEVLSQDESVEVRLAVVHNPNAALSCLLKLAREFPEAFFLNPLCPLLDLSDPGWYAQIDDETWLYLLKSAQIPRRWLKWLEEKKRPSPVPGQTNLRPVASAIWIAARLHMAMPELHAHGEHIGHEMAIAISAVAGQERTPGLILAELASIVCRYESLAEIGNAVCDRIPRIVAQNPQAPEDVLRHLALADDPKIRYSVGLNPRISLDVLARLALDPSGYVRSGVAANRALSPGLLEFSAAERSEAERGKQGEESGGTSMDAGVKERLWEALTNQALVAGALARNEAIPGPLLRSLASHPEVAVREKLAENPATPADVLLGLASDQEQVLYAMVAVNPHVPAAVLAQLAEHQASKIRIAVAKHPRTPGEALARLVRDSHLRVREAVAKHPSTPPDALAHLAQEGENGRTVATTVRAAVALNPVTPRKLLARLAKQQYREITVALAKNPCLPTDLIEQLVKDEQKDVCLQIANHPHLTPEELAYLTQHPSPPVVELARKRLELRQELGARGEQEYVYRVNLYEREKLWLGEGALASMPLYEIQRCAQDMLNPMALPAFLAGFQLSIMERQEIFFALLPDLARKWERQANVWIELLAAFDLPPVWQRFFAASPLWLVRYAVALQPGIETSVLETLANDGNRYVCAAARWYLRER